MSTFAEEWHSSDAEDDPYLKSLVDNFIIADKDVCESSEDSIDKKAYVCESSEDSIDKKACSRRQTDKYAESALKYYNNDKNNKVKYLFLQTNTCEPATVLQLKTTYIWQQFAIKIIIQGFECFCVNVGKF